MSKAAPLHGLCADGFSRQRPQIGATALHGDKPEDQNVTKTSGLTTRQFERNTVELLAEFVISPEHCTQVQFSSSSAALGQHALSVRAVDISSGGMGLECRQFIPRQCEGVIRVFDPAAPADAAGVRPVLFEHRVKVRRLFMLNAQPTYALGVAFIGADPGLEDHVSRLRALGATRQGGRDAA